MKLTVAIFSVAFSVLGGVSVASAETRAASRLVATVGPGTTITLVDAGGANVTRIKAGTYVILVRDRSSRHNFHLVEPDPLLLKRTSLRFVGSVMWRIHLDRGVYRFVCDAHPFTMHGRFKVV
jgi:hypothetical protein